MPEGDEEDDGKRKPNKAKIDDDFLRHPYTNSLIRNPLRVKDDSGTPIILAKEDYEHNCMDEALYGWKQIRVDEVSFNKMICNDTLHLSPRTLRKRALLGKMSSLSNSYTFVVNLEKADFVEPRGSKDKRRREKEPPRLGTKVDKVEIEVNEIGKCLRIEKVAEGLMAAWNRNNPMFLVQPGDFITRVNQRKVSLEMLEELASQDALRLTIDRRPAVDPAEETKEALALDSPSGAAGKNSAADQSHEVAPRKPSKVKEPEVKETIETKASPAVQTLKPTASGHLVLHTKSGRKSKKHMPPPRPVMPGPH